MKLCPACEADTGRSDGVRCRECGHLFDDYCSCDFCSIQRYLFQPLTGTNKIFAVKAVRILNSEEDEESIGRIQRYTRMPREKCIELLQEFDWHCENAIEFYWRNYVLTCDL